MSESKSLDLIKKAIEYIEANIREPLKLDDISVHSHVSKFHLNRIFKAITGKQLMDYVRNRKLAHSIHSLLYTDMKIIDIAMDYGFQYEQSYIRAFKKAFGISPNKARKVRCPLEAIEKINLNYFFFERIDEENSSDACSEAELYIPVIEKSCV